MYQTPSVQQYKHCRDVNWERKSFKVPRNGGAAKYH